MIIPGKHYVTLDDSRRFRKYAVIVTEIAARRGRFSVEYGTVSRHLTWKGANKAVRRLNGGKA